MGSWLKTRWIYPIMVLINLLALTACAAAPAVVKQAAPTSAEKQKTLQLIDFYSPM